MHQLNFALVSFLLLLSNPSWSCAQVQSTSGKAGTLNVAEKAISGYWAWNEKTQTNEWIESRYVQPQSNRIWVQGHWVQTGNERVWIPGRFQQTAADKIKPQIDTRVDPPEKKEAQTFSSYNARFKQELNRRRARDAAYARQAEIARKADPEFAKKELTQLQSAQADSQQWQDLNRWDFFLQRQQRNLQDVQLRQLSRQIQSANQSLTAQFQRQETLRAQRQNDRAAQLRQFEQQRQRALQEAQRIQRFNEFQRAKQQQEALRKN